MRGLQWIMQQLMIANTITIPMMAHCLQEMMPAQMNYEL